jgi:molybdopterin molybdotransferase
MGPAETVTILSFEDARHQVEQQAATLRPKGRELLSLLDCSGRVLAEPIHADRDFPPFPRATRDGYAVRSADVAKVPVSLTIVGEVKAGAAPHQLPAVEPGKAVAIMTGAAVPESADAVLMFEHTSRTGDSVEVKRSVASGENIVPKGAEAKKGACLLEPGTRLDYAGIALAASVGRSRLVLYSKPQVAILSTGDEVVDLDVSPEPNQIRNSNSYSLAAQIQAAGGEPLILPIAPDEPHRLRELLTEGFESDLLLIAGGVSMGKYDLVEQVLAELKAEFFFTCAHIQPGKPIVFGRTPGSAGDDQNHPLPAWKYFFGLPGNPISTMVTFELFVRPVLAALAGMTARPLAFTHARLKSPVQTKTGLKRFLPALLSGEFELAEVELVRWQGSGDIASLTRSNCYLVIPPDRERIAAGEWVPVLLR